MFPCRRWCAAHGYSASIIEIKYEGHFWGVTVGISCRWNLTCPNINAHTSAPPPHVYLRSFRCVCVTQWKKPPVNHESFNRKFCACSDHRRAVALFPSFDGLKHALTQKMWIWICIFLTRTNFPDRIAGTHGFLPKVHVWCVLYMHHCLYVFMTACAMAFLHAVTNNGVSCLNKLVPWDLVHRISAKIMPAVTSIGDGTTIQTSLLH